MREATMPSIHQQLLENTLLPETPKPAIRGLQNCCAGGLKMLSRRACFASANRHVQILSAYMRKTNHALYSNWGPASTEPTDKKMSPSIMCHAQYHKIIDHYVNKGDVDSVENIMAEMNRNGIPPNISTVNKLLATYTVRKDGMGAQKVMDEMYKAGIVPDNSSISQLMNAYTSEGNFEAADSVVKAAIRNDIVLGS
jgi:pentatricopeptide repeat protein